ACFPEESSLGTATFPPPPRPQPLQRLALNHVGAVAKDGDVILAIEHDQFCPIACRLCDALAVLEGNVGVGLAVNEEDMGTAARGGGDWIGLCQVAGCQRASHGKP